MSQQENIYELPLFKAHVLLLADIVADAAELQAAAETSTDAVLERALKRKE